MINSSPLLIPKKSPYYINHLYQPFIIKYIINITSASIHFAKTEHSIEKKLYKRVNAAKLKIASHSFKKIID